MKALHSGTDLVETDPSPVSGLEHGLRGEHLVERVEHGCRRSRRSAERASGGCRWVRPSFERGRCGSRAATPPWRWLPSAVPYTTCLGGPWSSGPTRVSRPMTELETLVPAADPAVERLALVLHDSFVAYHDAYLGSPTRREPLPEPGVGRTSGRQHRASRVAQEGRLECGRCHPAHVVRRRRDRPPTVDRCSAPLCRPRRRPDGFRARRDVLQLDPPTVRGCRPRHRARVPVSAHRPPRRRRHRGEYRNFPVDESLSESSGRPRAQPPCQPVRRPRARRRARRHRIQAELDEIWDGYIDSIDILRPVFYRNKGATSSGGCDGSTGSIR